MLSGRKIGKSISWRLMRDWAAEVSGNPIWIVDQSYDLVGDLSETLSLLLPETSDGSAAPPLHEVIEQRLCVLAKEPLDRQRQIVVSTWSELSTSQKLVFHKLLRGNYRVGVSRQLLIRVAVRPRTLSRQSSRIAWQANGRPAKKQCGGCWPPTIPPRRRTPACRTPSCWPIR